MEGLTSIWKRVLKRPSVGEQDNFFDLGGDALSAIELFTAISKELGRELPPLTIFQAPTPARLAALLSESEVPSLSAAVLMKGGKLPHIFITHGLGGSVL